MQDPGWDVHKELHVTVGVNRTKGSESGHPQALLRGQCGEVSPTPLDESWTLFLDHFKSIGLTVSSLPHTKKKLSMSR